VGREDIPPPSESSPCLLESGGCPRFQTKAARTLQSWLFLEITKATCRVVGYTR